MGKSSKQKVIVLSIAGSDPSGGAGVYADAEAIKALGGKSIFAVTALTAQDEESVFTIHPTNADVLSQQLSSAVRLNPPKAIKVGMVATLANARVISWFLDRFKSAHIVIDPIIHSSSGYPLLEQTAVQFYKNELLQKATVVTPNISEAEAMAGQQIISVKTMESAAKVIHDDIKKMRAKDDKPLSVIVKGGHLDGDEVVDVLYDGEGWRYFSGHKIEGKSPRGTGCRFASALATALAQNENMINSIEKAREYLRQYIQENSDK